MEASSLGVQIGESVGIGKEVCELKTEKTGALAESETESGQK
jgi:hypothetical protein